jgi:iron complex transport system substrate-binding protein
MKRLLLALLFAAAAARAEVTVVDDTGKRIVGAINYSDHPPEARAIPTVGSNSQLDLERVVALKPDLLIVWQSGNTARQIEQLERLGIPVFRSEPRTFEQVAASIERFGQLLGTDVQAVAAAAAYRSQLARLAARYGQRPAVRVFYQVWDKPLYTLNGKQIVSDAIRLCGGRNVFADLPVVAPEVGVEAVLQQDPEAIVAGDEHAPGDRGVNIWKAYGSLQAVRRNNLFALDGELLTRPGPRTILGAAQLCEKIELARRHRP